MFLRRGSKITTIENKVELDFIEKYEKLIESDGLEINDYYLWKTFMSLYKSELKERLFFGISFQKTKTYEQDLIEDSHYYIKEINDLYEKQLKKIKDDKNNFEFKFYPFHEIVLKLWRELLKDAIVYLKEMDKREKYHDWETFGIDELYKYFKRFIEFEEVLYENIPYYRDHVFHVFRVFLIGIILLFKKNKEKLNSLKIYQNDDMFKEIEKVYIKELEEAYIKEMEKASKKAEKTYIKKIKNEKLIQDNEKVAMWFIISLTHDLGYPLEKLTKINSKVREMLEAFGRSKIQEIDITFPQQGHFINDFVLKFISSRLERCNKSPEEYKLHIQSKYWLKLSRAFEDYDHGIVSCVLLMKYLVYFLESDYLLDDFHTLKIMDQKQFQIRREILRSIAIHNCNDIYHLNINNFQFLLTFLDELQCWGRPSGRMTTHTLGWRVKLEKFDNEKIDYTIILNTIHKDKETRSIFLNICKKYTKIFRGAVDGANRDFDVHFKVKLGKDKARSILHDKKQNIVCLEYFHQKPSNVKVDDEKSKYYEIFVNEHFISEDKKLESKVNIPYHAYVAITKDDLGETMQKIEKKRKDK